MKTIVTGVSSYFYFFFFFYASDLIGVNGQSARPLYITTRSSKEVLLASTDGTTNVKVLYDNTVIGSAFSFTGITLDEQQCNLHFGTGLDGNFRTVKTDGTTTSTSQVTTKICTGSATDADTRDLASDVSINRDRNPPVIVYGCSWWER